MKKDAGLRNVAKALPTVAKKVPAKGKDLWAKANTTAATIATRHPKLYREMVDPANYAGLPTALKRMFGG